MGTKSALQKSPNPPIPDISTGKPENYGKSAISPPTIPHNPTNSGPNHQHPTTLEALLASPSRDTLNTAYFQKLTEALLQTFYPKYCDECGTVMTSRINTRPYTIRCSKCYAQKSRLSYTPLHHFKLPMWPTLAIRGFVGTPDILPVGCSAGHSMRATNDIPKY